MEDEAVVLANESAYGLSARVRSRDVDRPMRVVRRPEAGLVSINGWASLAVASEGCGFKASGLGRLGGLALLEDLVDDEQITQTVDGGH